MRVTDCRHYITLHVNDPIKLQQGTVLTYACSRHLGFHFCPLCGTELLYGVVERGKSA